MERQPAFNRLSADIGQLDEKAFEELLADDSDQALELLAMMTQATDRKLARLARRLAGRLLLELTTAGPAQSRGIGKLVARKAEVDSNELDLDASMDSIQQALAKGNQPSLDDLMTRYWARPDSAICLLVDRSGSMDGARLASAALAAAACSWRKQTNLAVLAFSDRVLTLKDMGRPRPADDLVNAVLSLRGHGTTDIALALEAASHQLNRVAARRKLVLLLSDGESTTGDDPLTAARRIDELAIVGPADEPAHVSRLARHGNAALQLVEGPMDVVTALNAILR